MTRTLDYQTLAVRTPTLPPATHTNSYAIGGREVILIEPSTPYEEEKRAWVQWAEGLRSTGRRLVAIVATHHHTDHISGASFFTSQLGLPLWAHEQTAERIDTPVQRFLNDNDSITLDGPDAENWRILHTPGHAPGHVCLYESQRRTLIVGDMVASEGTILIAPGEGNMGQYLEQLDRLDQLDAAIALPAHGLPISEPTHVFRHYIKHRLNRENKVLSALRSMPNQSATDEQLLPLAYDDTAKSLWPFALLSLQAHLEKLVQEGRVTAYSTGQYRANEV